MVARKVILALRKMLSSVAFSTAKSESYTVFISVITVELSFKLLSCFF